jgi:NADPH:quinone reductase-like Zn-dependent oxidoreductase
LITGVSGGVALFALQFAVAVGAHVYVTSSSPEKIEKAIKLGAKGGANYKDSKDIYYKNCHLSFKNANFTCIFFFRRKLHC